MRRTLGRALASAAPLLGRIPVSVDNPDPAVVLIPSDGPGSAGDEASVKSAAAMLLGSTSAHLPLILADPGPGAPRWRVDGFATQATGDARFGLLAAPVRRLARRSVCGRMVILGADVIDGAYSTPQAAWRLSLARQLASTSEVSVISFSLSERVAPSVAKQFRTLPTNVKLTCRDPLSAERFRYLMGRQLSVYPDLAFAFLGTGPSPYVRASLDFIERQRKGGRLVVGLNVNREIVRRFGGIGAVAREVRTMVGRLGSTECSLVLIPHDRKGEHPDERVLQAVLAKLNQANDPVPAHAAPTLSASDIRCLVRALDVCVTGRMHLMVAAICSGTATLGLEYLDKFEGLQSLVGLPIPLVREGEMYWGESVANRVEDLMRLPSLSGELEDRARLLGALARKHIE